MKKVIFNRKNRTILSTIIMALLLNIQGNAKVNVLKLSEDKKLILDLTDMYGGHATAMIKDQSGSIIFTDQFKQADQNAKKYDLSKLKEGSYQLILEDAMTVETVPFTLSNTKIEYLGEAHTVYKPKVDKKDGKFVVINHLALNKAVNLVVSKNGEEFYSENYEDEPSLGLRIDFSKAESGNYVIKLSTQGETFYNTISI